MDVATDTGGNSSPAPTSFSDSSLTWSDASPASTPDQSSSTPAPAEQAQTTEAALPQQDDRSPFIPRSRFDEVNTKYAEAKTALETLEGWKQQHGWAEQVNPQEFQQLQTIARHFQSGNVIDGLQSLMAEIRKDPQHDAALKSLAARALAQRSSPANAEPQMVNVQLEDGSVVAMPRDPAAWLAHQKQQWQTEVEQKFAPFQKTVEDLQAEKAAAAQQQAITQFVETTFKDVQTWPGMTDEANQKALGEALKTMRVNEHDPREVALALNAAYRSVVLPKLQSKSESALLDDLKRKAASTGINPGSVAASAPTQATSFFDKSLKWK